MRTAWPRGADHQGRIGRDGLETQPDRVLTRRAPPYHRVHQKVRLETGGDLGGLGHTIRRRYDHDTRHGGAGRDRPQRNGEHGTVAEGSEGLRDARRQPSARAGGRNDGNDSNAGGGGSLARVRHRPRSLASGKAHRSWGTNLANASWPVGVWITLVTDTRTFSPTNRSASTTTTMVPSSV